MNEYLRSTEEALAALESGKEGLSEKQAAERLERDGKNKLAERKKTPLILRFLKSLADPMIIMLLCAAAITGVIAVIKQESLTDVFIILFVVVVNTILSLVQESKAEAAIGALMEMTAATSRVIRGGQIRTVKSEDLVRGDIVALEAGDSVPADCRILESYSLKAEEAALTGESVPVMKLAEMLTLTGGQTEIPLGDRTNMLYSGSTVVYGRGKAVVAEVGMATEMGKIAAALSTADTEKTPLQRRMAELSRILTWLVIGICAVVFAVGLVRNGFSGAVVLDTFMMAVALAVAAIPEGLPAVITIVLSIGVTAMSKRQALIRKLTAVETLGCTQVICSDKTGTLTQNRMTVVDCESPDRTLLARAMALCSDAELEPTDETAQGEPTECALVNYAATLGMRKFDLKAEAPRIGEAPFDSERKMMSTVHREADGRVIQYTKGACEMVLQCCTQYLAQDGLHPVTDAYRAEIAAHCKTYADRALRVLGAAMRVYDAPPADNEPESLEAELVFLGFVGMIDPCRPEVRDAVAECRRAGIRPVMITGDHRDTAVAIGRELDILSDESQAVTGEEIGRLSDEELKEAVLRYSVYARVKPEHKTRIVRAWQSHDCVVAMTGDGVNDAPSIRAADIGIGMGITGTAVTKGVADMVLADDNFATIVHAVEEGRKIYDNVRKVLQFQLSTNAAEVLAVFASSLCGFAILSPVQLLWINMVTDSTPGLALGMEKAEGDVMARKPSPQSESIFSGGAGLDIVLQGILMAGLVMLSYFSDRIFPIGGAGFHGQTMAFLTMNFVEAFRAICARSRRASVFSMKTHNKWIFGSVAMILVLTSLISCVPFFAGLFKIATVNLTEYFVAFGLALLIIPAVELTKLVRRTIEKKKQA